MAEESKTAVIAALGGNLALAILKGIAAAVTGSAAMLAETFHSIADTGNQVLLAVGMRLATRPPDRAHPFGHGKDIYFWAFVVSMLLFNVGGAFAIWEGIHALRTPDAAMSRNVAWAYGVLAGAFVFESASFVVAIRSLEKVKRDLTFREFWHVNRDPTLMTVVLEDGAALVSILVAATGLTLRQLTGAEFWDGIASLLIGGILIAVALLLGFENYSLLIGEAAPPKIERKIREIASHDEAVARVVGLRTMHVGPESILVVLIVKFRDDLDVPDVEAAVARLHAAIVDALGEDTTDPRLVIVEPAPRAAARPRRAA
jgi:cation diffusion facilitator family transporter